jgi:hypothetical protein
MLYGIFVSFNLLPAGLALPLLCVSPFLSALISCLRLALLFPAMTTKTRLCHICALNCVVKTVL